MNLETIIIGVVIAIIIVAVSAALSCWGCPLWGIDRALYLKTMEILQGKTKWNITKTKVTQDMNSRTYKLEFNKGDVPLTIECHKSGLTYVNCDYLVINRYFTAPRVYSFLEKTYKMQEKELKNIKSL